MRIFNIGNRIMNIYIIKIKSGYMLIDTGYKENFKGFLKGLEEIGVKPSEVSLWPY